MATFDKTIAGQFRANPDANVKNNLALLDPKTPGTPQEDTGTAATGSATLFDGYTYTGKDGQSVPVGVGQPSLKIDNLTVGGTA